MPNGVCLIYFRSGKCDLDSAERVLSERGLTVSRASDFLDVRWENGPRLRVAVTQGERVQEEAAELAESYTHAYEVGQCDARFEITFDELEEVLDEINTLIEVQAALEK